jgi:hypothetical protein
VPLRFFGCPVLFLFSAFLCFSYAFSYAFLCFSLLFSAFLRVRNQRKGDEEKLRKNKTKEKKRKEKKRKRKRNAKEKRGKEEKSKRKENRRPALLPCTPGSWCLQATCGKSGLVYML